MLGMRGAAGRQVLNNENPPNGTTPLLRTQQHAARNTQMYLSRPKLVGWNGQAV
jgi:hypothetical protein